MFDAEQFLIDHGIEKFTEGKNVTDGWVNIQCPFPECNDHSNHGGFNPAEAYYNCWKCGHHHLDQVIMELLKCTRNESKELIEKYTYNNLETRKQEEIKRPEKLVLPVGIGPLEKRHRKYLEKRNFDPDKLEREWKLQGTNHLGEYCFRIFAPIYYKHRMVSFQCRDVTGQTEIRYMACAKKDEVIHHKHILYGIDYVKTKGVLVEGITDVWRLGPMSIASFGTGWTEEQMQLISKRMDNLFILYDEGEEAQERAEKLAYQFSSIGKKAEIITGVFDEEGDPAGSLNDAEAKYLMGELLR